MVLWLLLLILYPYLLTLLPLPSIQISPLHIFPNIGSTLDIWGRRFVLTGADRYVLSYVRQHAEKISPKVLSSLATFFGEDEPKESQGPAEENP